MSADAGTVRSSASPVTGGATTAGKDTSDAGQRREVDYYLNPTELFRWINYRRWDGAKARVLSHPDECSTWIADAASVEGHGAQAQQTGRQIEELVDVLLETYPDGANSPDDQGVDVKDKYGRTPLDLLNEKGENGPQSESSLRAMIRAKRTTDKMISSVREENSEVVASMKQSSANERMASQRIIMRLEQELETSQVKIDQLEAQKRTEQESGSDLQFKMQDAKRQLDSSHSMMLTLKRERDDLMNQNEILSGQVEDHENVMKKIHQEFEGERREQADELSKLRSEVSTAKAMASALESQLRSRFTNEEYLTTTVSELETQIADIKSEYQQTKTKLTNERDTFKNENTQLLRHNEELSKKSASLQSKLTEMNKQMSAVLSSHGALNAEHDRLTDASVRIESELIESIRAERTRQLSFMRKQWDFFQSSVQQQEKMMEESQAKEKEFIEIAKEERSRCAEIITGMRQDFHNARAVVMERQRSLQTDNLAPHSVQSPSSPKETLSTGLTSANHKRATKKSSETFSTGDKRSASRKSFGASTYTSRSSRPPSTPSLPTAEKRIPASANPSTGDKRQGPPNVGQMERNLLHLLEARAGGDGESRTNYVGTDCTSYGVSSSSTSGITSSLRRGPVNGQQKPLSINVRGSPQVPSRHFGDLSTASSGSTNHERFEMSRASASSAQRGRVAPVPRKHHGNTVDEYSASTSGSVSVGDSDSESSRLGSRQSRKNRVSPAQFSGMTNGMRLGMIRISDDAASGRVSDGGSGQHSRFSRQ